MPDIHYTDALLTVIFAGGIAFMLWSVQQFNKLERRMMKHEKKMRKFFVKANQEGAETVAKAMREIAKLSQSQTHGA